MGSGVFVIKGIKPKRLKDKEIRLALLGAIRKEGTVHRKELRKTIKTWEGEKPKFESLVSLTRPPGGASVLTGPTGSEHAVWKWRWLDEGTSIRWALMSSDWRSKTIPGQFVSRSGSGRVVIVGAAMMGRGIAPRPGIEPRRWSELLSKRRKRPFTKLCLDTIRDAAQDAF